MSRSRTITTSRRGVVLIAVTWLLIVLTALAIILAYTMRVEVSISGNNLSQAQADAVELGAEQFVLSQVDYSNPNLLGDALSITDATVVNCEARPVGTGYFWIITPNPDYPDQYLFAITDECGKLNLNTATLPMLQNLPGMSDNANTTIPASIIAWRGNGKVLLPTDTLTASTNADQQYYSSFPSPYACKNAGFETVDELMMVKGIVQDPGTTPGTVMNYVDPLYGYDKNHNGIMDQSELNGTGTLVSADQPGALGIAPFVTVYSAQPATSPDGTALVNVNTASTSQMTTLLQKYLSGSRANTVLRATTQGRPFRNVLDYYTKSGMTVAEFSAIASQIIATSTTTGGTGGAGGGTGATSGATATTSTPGLINISTAPEAVLACLPGLTDSDVQALVSKRTSGADLSNVAWVVGTISAAKAAGIGSFITAQSYQYSADIVAVSGDGRSFKRVRIVVDAQTSPPKILYRKDMTSLGWPLDPGIREDLQAGRKLQTTMRSTISKSSSKGGT